MKLFIDFIFKHNHTRTHACAHARTHTQPFYGSMDFVQENPGEPVTEETFTHSHLSWSSLICFIRLIHP